MFEKCINCEKNYIEQGEHHCIDCEILFEEEREYDFISEQNVAEFFNEEWFLKGITLNTN